MIFSFVIPTLVAILFFLEIGDVDSFWLAAPRVETSASGRYGWIGELIFGYKNNGNRGKIQLDYSIQFNDHDAENRNHPILSETDAAPTSSMLRSISCSNLAGAYSAHDGESAIRVSFPPGQPYIACTGETGSGKSLLLARAIELLTGGKATSTLVGGKEQCDSDDVTGEQTAFVEIELWIGKPHLAFVQSMLKVMGVPDLTVENSQFLLTIRRTMVRSSKTRLKSVCTVNRIPVTLKALAALISPLLVVVDASAAAVALARPEARLAILDTAIDPAVLQFYVAAQRTYRQCRKQRQELEDDLANRLLPKSFSMDTQEDVELVDHWIEEIDALRARVTDFVESLSAEEDSSSLAEIMIQLQETDWMENASEKGRPYASALYERLKSLRDSLRSLDSQIVAASNAAAILSSLSMVESASTALEKSRKLLFEASQGDIASERLEEACERSHDLLNDAEALISKCARFIEDDDRGLLSTLETIRSCCPVSVNKIDELILDWNCLARKHGISPLTLPSCHKSMINERDGNVEALARLPKAVAAEKEALEKFKNACELRSVERKRVAAILREFVNRRLPSLGMTTSEFDITMNQHARKCSDSSAYSGNLGLDDVEFMLQHGTRTTKNPTRRGGTLHQVASSGEKARILLAIECSLPGSIRAVTGPQNTFAVGILPPPIPVTVVYDEIDAHVGGQAAVALGHMLADQSLQGQVIAITHSPAVAASADAHIVVQRMLSGDRTLIKVESKSIAERRQELARMASGDIAAEEAEVFAEALIRNGVERRKKQQKLEYS